MIILPIWHGVFMYMNMKFAWGSLRLLILQIIMFVLTRLAILLNSLMYFKLICYDSESIPVAQFEALCATVVVMIISVVAFVVRDRSLNKKFASIGV